MRFRMDREDEPGIWVDRGIDDRVDRFKPCTPCGTRLSLGDLVAAVWHDARTELCPHCLADIQAQGLANDLFGLPRPVNLDRPGGVVPNSVLEDGPRPAAPQAFSYFLLEEDEPWS